MGASIADERKLLAGNEYDGVARSHYPALLELPREELITLARWLREQRGKHRGTIEHRQRAGAALRSAVPGAAQSPPVTRRTWREMFLNPAIRAVCMIRDRRS